MKKAIITLAITTFITVSILAYLQPSTSSNVSNWKITASNAELYIDMKDSLKEFNKESEAKIGKFEVSISEYKTRIINEKKDNINRTAKKLAELNK
jgi:peptidoglycan hydrolase CwlO-like protein